MQKFFIGVGGEVESQTHDYYNPRYLLQKGGLVQQKKRAPFKI